MYNTLLMNNRTLYKTIGKLNNNIPHNNMITGRNGMINDDFNDEGRLDAMISVCRLPFVSGQTTKCLIYHFYG